MPDIVYRAGNNTTVAQRSTLTLTIPATCQVNDLCLAWAAWDNATDFTPPSGWVEVESAVTLTRGAVYWHRVGVGEAGTTVAFTLTNDWCQGGIEAYKNVATAAEQSDPQDVAATVDSDNADTTPTCPSLTTVTNNAWLVGFCLEPDAGNAHSSVNLANERRDVSSAGIYDDIQVTAGATGDQQISSGPTALISWIAILVALTPTAIVIEEAPTLLGPGVGAWTATSNASFSPPLLAGWAENDIFLLVTHANNNTTLNDLSGSGWAQISALCGNNTAGQRVEVWWKRATSSESAPSCSLVNNSVTIVRGGRIYVIRGCPTTGNPFDEQVGGAPTRQDSSASATVSFDDVTISSGTNRLVLALIAYEDDPTTIGTISNFTQPTGAVDRTTLGNDAMMGVEYRVLPTAAAAGATSLNVSGGTFANSVNVGLVIAFMPIPVSASVTVTPPTASLVLTGFAPTVSTPRLVTPTTASLALTGFAPTVSTPSAVTPSTASLVLTGFAPTIALTAHEAVTPATASLVLATFAPSVLTPSSVIPPTASLILATFAPEVTTPSTLIPTTASLTLTGFAPTVSATAHVVVIPGPGSLVLTGFAPNVLTPSVITPLTASLTLTAFEPTVSFTQHITITPARSSLVLSGFAPSVLTPSLLTPATASLLLTTFAPTVLTPTLVIPDLANLTLTGFAPSVITPSVLTPLTASLVLTGFAPTVSTPALIIPGSASLILTGFAPTIVTPSAITPATASLVLTSFEPTVEQSDQTVATPITASLVLTGFAPSVSTPSTITPGVASLVLTSFAPEVIIPSSVTPGVASLVLTTFAPVVTAGASVVVIPGTAQLVLTTFPPTVSVTASTGGSARLPRGPRLRRRPARIIRPDRPETHQPETQLEPETLPDFDIEIIVPVSAEVVFSFSTHLDLRGQRVNVGESEFILSLGYASDAPLHIALPVTTFVMETLQEIEATKFWTQETDEGETLSSIDLGDSVLLRISS